MSDVTIYGVSFRRNYSSRFIGHLQRAAKSGHQTWDKHGISPGILLAVMGVQIVIIGLVYSFVFKEYTLTLKSGILTSCTGIVWACATCFISVALSKYNMPISNLVPLFNMNTLVAVCLGLVVFAEWKNINLIRLFAASVLIVIGGILATKA